MGEDRLYSDRSRTFRRRYAPERFTPAGVLASANTILYERHLEEYYCTLCYAAFDFKRRTVLMANSGLPYPIRCSGSTCAQIELPGVPLGSFAGSSYDELMFELKPSDLFVFCTDGVYEANDALGREFGAERLLQVIREARDQPARELVDRIFAEVQQFRGDAHPQRRHDRRGTQDNHLIQNAVLRHSSSCPDASWCPSRRHKILS